jgi:hypothetical protein
MMDLHTISALVNRGEYLMAYDACLQALRCGHSGNELRKIHARSAAALGMNHLAIEILQEGAISENGLDAESLALLGSFHKRIWLAETQLTDLIPGNCHFEDSFKCYLRSHELDGGYWSAVNTATLARVRGDAELAHKMADFVINSCWSEYTRHGTNSPFWTLASLGEAYLVKGDFGLAKKWFQTTRSHLGGNLGWVAATRRNARLLLKAMDSSAEQEKLVLDAIPELILALFAGHRIDVPGRKVPRFPVEVTGKVTRRLRDALVEMRIDLGIASMADGSDILFHECMHKMGRPTMAVLPCPTEHFRKRLESNADSTWLERFDSVMAHVLRTETASISRFDFEPEAVHTLCADFMLGLSFSVAQEYDARLIPLVIWDGRTSSIGGGTSYIISRLNDRGVEPVRISIPVARHNRSSTTRESFVQKEIPDLSIVLILVAALNLSAICDEDNALRSATLFDALTDLCSARGMRVVQTSTTPELLVLLIEPARRIPELVESCMPLCKNGVLHSLLLHAGICVNTRSEFSLGRLHYCRDLLPAVEIARKIDMPGELLCTINSRSLMSMTMCSQYNFGYMGSFSVETGSTLKLFRINHVYDPVSPQLLNK